MAEDELPVSLAGRPRIGITSGTNPGQWGPEGNLWKTLKIAVEDAGGEGIWVGAADFPDLGPERFGEALNGLDGLLLAGGPDLVPEDGVYVDLPYADGSDTALLEAYHLSIEPGRDVYEVPLARRALELDMPVFGICRGFQLLNVAAGGRLIPDLRTGLRHCAYSETVSAAHLIRSRPGSRMDELYGQGFVPINSRHHQGVVPELLAPGLEATAFAPDGIVEAVEDPERPWRFAVQWHPERPEEAALYERDRSLFRAFVKECRRR